MLHVNMIRMVNRVNFMTFWLYHALPASRYPFSDDLDIYFEKVMNLPTIFLPFIFYHKVLCNHQI